MVEDSAEPALARTLPALAARLARACAEKILLRDAAQSFTGAEFHADETYLAAALAAQGIEPGSRVALALPPCPLAYAALFALGRRGCVAVPLPLAWPPAAMRDFMAAETIPVVLAPANFAAPPGMRVLDPAALLAARVAPAPMPRVAPETPLLLLLTSGSTGQPKRILHSHGSLLGNAATVGATLGFGGADLFLQTSPLNSMFGVGFFAVAAMAGAGVVVTANREIANLLALTARHGVTVFSGNFPLYAEIAAQDDAPTRAALASVRHCVLGGALVSAGLGARIRATFGATLHVIYGMTEVAGAIATCPVGADHPTGRVGPPIAGTALEIRGPDGARLPPGAHGEIWVRSASAHHGAAGTWFSTEDAGMLDAAGQLSVIGRMTQVWRGPAGPCTQALCEMELVSDPDVKLASVKRGPAGLTAWVVLRPHGRLASLRARLARHPLFGAAPLALHQVEHFPMTASGKIDQLALERIAGKQKEPA